MSKFEPTKEDLEALELLKVVKEKYSLVTYSKENITAAILDTCQAFDGITEIGKSNTGFWVNTFLKDVGLGGGYAWCLAAVQYVYKYVSVVTFGKKDLIPNNTAGTQNLAAWAEKKKLCVYRPEEVKPGDIIIWRNGIGKNRAQGHVAVIKTSDTTKYTTYEGNTSSANWRDGGAFTTKAYKWNQFGVIGQPRKDSEARYIRCVISLDKLINLV